MGVGFFLDGWMVMRWGMGDGGWGMRLLGRVGWGGGFRVMSWGGAEGEGWLGGWVVGWLDGWLDGCMDG